MDRLQALSVDDKGLEGHQGIDQFMRFEEGGELCQMGLSECNLSFAHSVNEDDTFLFLQELDTLMIYTFLSRTMK